MAWANDVGMVGFVSRVVARKVSFLLGLVILFLALVCIGWAFVTGGGDGVGIFELEVEEELDGSGSMGWSWEGASVGVEISGCTCIELDNV